MRPKRTTAGLNTIYRLKLGLARDLRSRFWLRGHALSIGLLTLLASWAASHLLMMLGVESLGWRYITALSCAYGTYLLMMWLWCRSLVDRRAQHSTEITIDLPTPSGGGRCAQVEPHVDVFAAGGGGDFSGAGASASFDSAGVDSAANIAAEGGGKVLEAAFSADEGVVIAVPLALTVGLGVALAVCIGAAFLCLFSVEVLLALAVELAFSTTAGLFAYRAWHEGWLWVALGKTFKPLLALILLSGALGFAVDYWVPQAKSLPHAVKLIF